jgi:hypothetical protein
MNNQHDQSVMPASDDKRHFSRVMFDTSARLTSAGKTFDCSLIDLSLHGALVTVPDGWQGQTGDIIDLDIILQASGAVIHMQTIIAHQEDNHMGLQTEHIDLDSISHLRRLIELNVGDADILNRELGELVHAND